MTVWIVLLPVLVFVVGLVLLIRGLRGRRVDDHPICRRCGFDLFNRPASSERCPECGADLHGPHAIQQGHRQRRGGLIGAGSFLLAIVLLGVGFFAWVTLSSSNWWQRAPVWWLRYEAGSVDPKSRDAALAELIARIAAGKLSQARIDQLADRALTYQGDKAKAWIPGWGDFVEAAEAASKLSSDRWQKYLAQAPNLRLELRSDINRGDRLYYWLRSGNARIGNRANFYVNYEGQSWDVDSIRNTKNGGVGGGTNLSLHGNGGLGTSFDLSDPSNQLADGTHTVRYTVDLKIDRNWSSGAKPMATTRYTVTGTFNLHPASQPVVTINHDPSYRAGVEAALSCNHAEYGTSWSPKQLNVTISVSKLPVGVGYDVFARINGKDTKLGSFACPKNPDTGGFGFGNAVPAFDAATVDLVLKPSSDAAIGTTNTFEIWEGEVILKNVPVKRNTPPPATTTSTTTRAAR